VHHFPDMHNIGDAAVRAGLVDPVLDVDRLKIRYEEPTALFRDLTGSGARNCLLERSRSLTSKSRFDALCRALQSTRSGTGIELDLELVFGHCWGSGRQAGTEEVRISLNQIGKRN
jgi:malonyl-CoA O-methyltransferase